MIRRIISLFCALLLLVSVLPAAAEETGERHHFDLDLTFSLNANAFPELQRSRASGYADLLSRIGLTGTVAWNDDVTYYRLERKKNRIVIYDAHSDERDKYATKFKFSPDNYTYSIKDSQEGYYITLKAKKGVKGIKEARCLLDKKTRYPISVRIKMGIFHTTIKISNVKVGGISDDLFKFPREKYSSSQYEYIDNR